MPSKPDGRQRNERIVFTRPAAERIAAVVRQVESGDTSSSGLVLRKGPLPQSDCLKVFRVCTFTGAWNINSSKTVTFKYQTTTPNTVTALNLFANVPNPPSAANCAIAREGTAWFLIAAECITTPT